MADSTLADLYLTPKYLPARAGLAPGRKEAQLQLADGTPVSGWLKSPEAFDAALAAALQRYARDELHAFVEEAM